jgi:hypothetical protein
MRGPARESIFSRGALPLPLPAERKASLSKSSLTDAEWHRRGPASQEIDPML